MVDVCGKWSAHQEAMYGIDAEVAAVKEGVQAGPQEQFIGDPVLAAERGWSDMGSLKH